MKRIAAGCKINIGLRVVSRLPDGYHEIDSILYPLPSPHDEIYIWEIPKGFELECDAAIEPEKNLVFRAWKIFGEATGRCTGAHVVLRKGIPMGSGLGGGSSDAAAILGWLNLRHPQDEKLLMFMAARIGADVPFFLANRILRATGKGEILQPPEKPAPKFHVVLVWPGINISTAWAFHEYDALTMKKARGGGAQPEYVLTKKDVGVKQSMPSCSGEGSDFFALAPENDLELAVFPHYPELAALKRKFTELGAFYASMSGSGSSVYGLFDSLDTGRAAAEKLRMYYKDVFFCGMMGCSQAG